MTTIIPTLRPPQVARAARAGRALRMLALATLGWIAAAAQAHEFWMLPQAFTGPPGRSTSLGLSVGENFAGERVGISRSFLPFLRWYAAGSSVDLRSEVPATPVAELTVRLPRAGTHLFAADTQPSHITLTADKFHAYLHEEGLDTIIRQREAAGTAATPGRERFQRNLKTLLQAGSRPDATHAVRTGQRLELVPLANPYRLAPGKDLSIQVYFDGQPLAGALVKTWHRRGEQTLIIRTVSGDDGKVTVTLPWAGTWMVSVVHMVALTDSPDHDWDSYWGNLSFELPAAGAARQPARSQALAPRH